jgi:CubicO group peptidase (beta-lactamase class C family)
MAKIGYLFLYKGIWKGEVIISEAWVNESTDKHKENDQYGYLWWRGFGYVNRQKVHFFNGSGYGGQKIYVFPSIEMVVVITSGNYGGNQVLAHFQTDIMVKFHILRALEQGRKK